MEPLLCGPRVGDPSLREGVGEGTLVVPDREAEESGVCVNGLPSAVSRGKGGGGCRLPVSLVRELLGQSPMGEGS